jgi:TetR/AcrR family transcriptional regulator, cholesterol catabolism regulator
MAEVLFDRKEQINEIAQNLFRTKGYAATSMRDLAKEIGIEPASIYSHVKSKEALLQNICFRIAAEFFDALQETLKKETTAETKLSNAIEAHVKVILNNLDATTVFFHEWKHLSEPSLSEFKTLRNKYEKQFRSIIEAGIATGEFDEVDAHVSIKLLFAMMNSIHEWYNPKGKLKQKEIVRNIVETFVFGIVSDKR